MCYIAFSHIFSKGDTMRILHVIAQKPGQTGSGIFLLNLIRVAANSGHEQCLVAGISINDKDYRQDLPESLLLYRYFLKLRNCLFRTGMSDEMPYRALATGK